jgi:hypothetical protein
MVAVLIASLVEGDLETIINEVWHKNSRPGRINGTLYKDLVGS